MQEITIKTRLHSRDDIFTVFAVGMSARVPVLLVGPAGTGKTQAFFDFVNSISTSPTDFFVRQLNFDTRAEDLVGYISIPDLKEGRVVRINGIQDSRFILLDEVDKASTSVRNLFLSLLREKMIFDGSRLVECKWELLVGTTNRREFDQEDFPFLDRFILKVNIERIGVNKAEELLNLNGTEKEVKITITDVDEEKLEEGLRNIKKILNDIYDKITDRTLALYPILLRSFLSVKNNDLNSALISLIAFTISEEFAISLIEKIGVSKEVVRAQELRNAFYSASDEETKASILAQILSHIRAVKTNPSVSRDDVRKVVDLLDPVVQEFNNA